MKKTKKKPRCHSSVYICKKVLHELFLHSNQPHDNKLLTTVHHVYEKQLPNYGMWTSNGTWRNPGFFFVPCGQNSCGKYTVTDGSKLEESK